MMTVRFGSIMLKNTVSPSTLLLLARQSLTALMDLKDITEWEEFIFIKWEIKYQKNVWVSARY